MVIEERPPILIALTARNVLLREAFEMVMSVGVVNHQA